MHANDKHATPAVKQRLMERFANENINITVNLGHHDFGRVEINYFENAKFAKGFNI